MDLVGNPSSIHQAGRQARRVLERARASIAACLGGDGEGLVFTSGGTEANALAVSGLAKGRRVLCGATEHAAVLAGAPDGIRIPVDANGIIDVRALDGMLAGPPALVCVMLANNETGVVAPIEAVAAVCRKHGALLHVDAVQAAGRMRVDMVALGADSLAVSGHKIGGPKGAGALLLAAGRDVAAALIAGGGQERGRRGGTPDLPAIAGFAAALEAAQTGVDLAGLRNEAEASAQACGAIVCGGGERLHNTSCLGLPGVRAETQVITLDLAGIAVSAGAACSSGKVTRSHVLDAMGLEALAGCAIRVSLPWDVSADDVTRFVAAYRVMALRLFRPAQVA